MARLDLVGGASRRGGGACLQGETPTDRGDSWRKAQTRPDEAWAAGSGRFPANGKRGCRRRGGQLSLERRAGCRASILTRMPPCFPMMAKPKRAGTGTVGCMPDLPTLRASRSLAVPISAFPTPPARNSRSFPRRVMYLHALPISAATPLYSEPSSLPRSLTRTLVEKTDKTPTAEVNREVDYK